MPPPKVQNGLTWNAHEKLRKLQERSQQELFADCGSGKGFPLALEQTDRPTGSYTVWTQTGGLQETLQKEEEISHWWRKDSSDMDGNLELLVKEEHLIATQCKTNSQWKETQRIQQTVERKDRKLPCVCIHSTTL